MIALTECDGSANIILIHTQTGKNLAVCKKNENNNNKKIKPNNAVLQSLLTEEIELFPHQTDFVDRMD